MLTHEALVVTLVVIAIVVHVLIIPLRLVKLVLRTHLLVVQLQLLSDMATHLVTASPGLQTHDQFDVLLRTRHEVFHLYTVIQVFAVL